eukprot:scaffold10296_cov63-Phaeocystis_antarctica.AAC.2
MHVFSFRHCARHLGHGALAISERHSALVVTPDELDICGPKRLGRRCCHGRNLHERRNTLVRLMHDRLVPHNGLLLFGNHLLLAQHQFPQLLRIEVCAAQGQGIRAARIGPRTVAELRGAQDIKRTRSRKRRNRWRCRSARWRVTDVSGSFRFFKCAVQFAQPGLHRCEEKLQVAAKRFHLVFDVGLIVGVFDVGRAHEFPMLEDVLNLPRHVTQFFWAQVNQPCERAKVGHECADASKGHDTAKRLPAPHHGMEQLNPPRLLPRLVAKWALQLFVLALPKHNWPKPANIVREALLDL